MSTNEISAGLPFVSNPFWKLHIFYFLSKVTVFLVLGVGTLALSRSVLGEFKNSIILETSQISLQNDSGCKVDLEFFPKGSVSGAKTRSIKRTAMPFKIPSFSSNSYLRFIRDSTPPPSSCSLFQFVKLTSNFNYDFESKYKEAAENHKFVTSLISPGDVKIVCTNIQCYCLRRGGSEVANYYRTFEARQATLTCCTLNVKHFRDFWMKNIL